MNLKGLGFVCEAGPLNTNIMTLVLCWTCLLSVKGSDWLFSCYLLSGFFCVAVSATRFLLSEEA